MNIKELCINHNNNKYKSIKISIFSEHVQANMDYKKAQLGYENIHMLSNYQFSCGDVSANLLTCL